MWSRLSASKRILMLSLAAVWLAGGRLWGAEAVLQTLSSAAPEFGSQGLQAIYRVTSTNGKERFATGAELLLGKLLPGRVAFFAICTNRWLPGLVPIFAVEKANRVELRRRPARGQENSSEPLFFALPAEGEPEAARLSGDWEVQAVRGSSGKEHMAWQLAVDGDQVSGRFDQNTEYRFADMVGGTFRSNRLELRVQYINDVYLLAGEWRGGGLSGTWWRADDEERGSWAARRGVPGLAVKEKLAPLYEWQRNSDEERRYALEGEPMEVGWERSPRPLCLVWQEAAAKRFEK